MYLYLSVKVKDSALFLHVSDGMLLLLCFHDILAKS